MASLADSIMAHGGSAPNVDNLGLPIKDGGGKDVSLRVEYLVARALLAQRKRKDFDEETTNCLHLKGDTIYYGGEELEESNREFYDLTQVNYAVPNHTQWAFWRELKDRLPQLYNKIIKVAPMLYWDIESGELISASYEELLERLRDKRSYAQLFQKDSPNG